MTRAAELAGKARWPYWSQDGDPMSDVGIFSDPLNPEHDLNHALALAECRWPLVEGWVYSITASAKNGWSFYAFRDNDDCEEMLDATPALAICAAVDAAGEKNG